MNTSPIIHDNHRLPLGLALVAALLVGLAYLPGTSGSLYFDDYLRLSPLANLGGGASLMAFVFGDDSGPLGRPLAMASFLPHQAHWPDHSSIMLGVNVVIHLVNGLLLFATASALARLCGVTAVRANWSALLVMTLWLVLPIQVSTSLIAIQRMASLSALFVLSGLLVYLWGLHLQLAKHPKAPLIQLGGVGVFTLLAALSKENGVLLPVFILIFELTLLAQRPALARFRAIRLGFGWAALVAISLYLIYHTYPMITSARTYVGRDFTLYERVITQPLILLDYLRLAFIPSIFEYSPFHDDYGVIRSLTSPVAAFALGLWGGLLLLAFWKRRTLPLLSFAILWFLAAHLIESTVIGLELYFEHRNYVALIGPVYALVHGVVSLPEPRRRLGVGALTLYTGLMAFMLVQVTSLWGQPLKAAEAWFVDNQRSSRAAQHLALFFLEQGNNGAAWKILNHQANLCGDCAQSRLQALLLSCVLEKEDATRHHYRRTLDLAATHRLTGVATSLGNIKKHVDDGSCTLLTHQDLETMNRAFLTRSQRSRGRDRAGLAMNLYLLSRSMGNEDLSWLKRSWRLGRNPGVGVFMTRTLLAEGRPEAARRFVESEICGKSASPLKALDQQARCANLRRLIESYQQQKAGEE